MRNNQIRETQPKAASSKIIPRDHHKATAKFNSVTDPAKIMANATSQESNPQQKTHPSALYRAQAEEVEVQPLYINKRKWRGKEGEKKIGVKTTQMSVVEGKRKRVSRSVFEIVSARATNKSGAVR